MAQESVKKKGRRGDALKVFSLVPSTCLAKLQANIIYSRILYRQYFRKLYFVDWGEGVARRQRPTGWDQMMAFFFFLHDKEDERPPLVTYIQSSRSHNHVTHPGTFICSDHLLKTVLVPFYSLRASQITGTASTEIISQSWNRGTKSFYNPATEQATRKQSMRQICRSSRRGPPLPTPSSPFPSLFLSHHLSSSSRPRSPTATLSTHTSGQKDNKKVAYWVVSCLNAFPRAARDSSEETAAMETS